MVGDPNGSLFDYNPGSSNTFSIGASGTGTAIGSKGGTTTIGAAQIYVESLAGYAQVGYHGDGGSGTINVVANGVPGTGGLTGIGACFDGDANICLIGGRSGSSGEGATPFAQIGDLGMGVAGSASANINVSATGNIAISGGGIYDNDSPDPEIPNAYGMIGNGDAAQATNQVVSGSTAVTAAGQLNFDSSSASGSEAWVGNRTGSGGSQSGNVTLVANELDNSQLTSMLIEDLGTSVGGGGDVTVGITGSYGIYAEEGATYSSPHTLNLLSSQGITVDGSIQNTGSGDINLVAGWDGQTLDPTKFANGGVYGNASGTVTIGGAGADGSVSVGSSGGTTTVDAGLLDVEATNGYAQLGYHGAGGGALDVNTTGSVSVQTNNATFAQIGNVGSGVAGSDTAAVTIYTSPEGEISLETNHAGSVAQIGNGGGYSSGNHGGDVSVTTGSVSLTTLGATSTALIGNGGDNSTGANSGTISVTASTGDVTLDGEALNSAAQIGNGGPNATGNNSGDITVSALAGNVTLEIPSGAGSAGTQIGNGGSGFNGNATGTIDVSANGTVSLLPGEANSCVEIGNGGCSSNQNASGGFTESGNITVTATNVLLQTTAGSTEARIGNGGSSAGSGATGNGAIAFGGNIAVTTGALTLDAEAGATDIQIGNGGDRLVKNAALTGGSMHDVRKHHAPGGNQRIVTGNIRHDVRRERHGRARSAMAASRSGPAPRHRAALLYLERSMSPSMAIPPRRNRANDRDQSRGLRADRQSGSGWREQLRKRRHQHHRCGCIGSQRRHA